MSKVIESELDPSRDVASRRPWLVAALLVVLTLAGSVAAKRAVQTTIPDTVRAGGLHQQVADALLQFDGRLDRSAVHVGSDGVVHLELVATGVERPDRLITRLPTDVVVVLDRSGSMGGDPMAKALASIRELVGQLGVDDRFALVTYANGADLALALEAATVEARARWTSSLGSIAAGGGTNMSAGLDRAHALISASREAGRVARIVLLSDGHANQGDATPDGLARRSSRAVAGEYVLSTVGVGEGFDERLMTRLADEGTGNFYYVPDVEVLAGIFAAEFESARQTVASALEIRIDTPDGVEVLDAAGYPLEQQKDYVLIRPGALFAGQARSFWVTLRVPTTGAGETQLGDVRVAYRTVEGEAREARLAAFPPIATVIDEASFVAALDPDAVSAHHAEDTINRLQQSISGLVSSGRYAAARDELDSVDYGELEALGYERERTASFRAIEKLKDEVERAAAAPAAAQPEVRNKVGKQLYEQGTDGRRKGAKR